MNKQITIVDCSWIFLCACSLCYAWFPFQGEDHNEDTGNNFDVLDNGMGQFKDTKALSDVITSSLDGFLLGNIDHVKYHVFNQVSCADQSTSRVRFTSACLRLLGNVGKRTPGATHKLDDSIVRKICNVKQTYYCRNITSRAVGNSAGAAAKTRLSQGQECRVKPDAQLADLIKGAVQSIFFLSTRYTSAFGGQSVLVAVLFDPSSYSHIYGVYFGVAHVLVRGVSFAISVEIGPSLQDHQLAGNELATKLWLLSGIYVPGLPQLCCGVQ